MLVETSLVAGWRIETWGPPAGECWREAVLRVVGDDGQVIFETRDAWLQVVTQGEPGRLGEHVAVAPGDDLNRDGGPNLLLEAYSGGAHCCFTYTLLALDQARVAVLMELFTSHAGAVVVDLAFPEAYHREVAWALEWLLLQDEDAAPSLHACALA